MTILILSFALIVLSLVNLRDGMINKFKISYYEAKLKNRNVDISHIENIGLKGIFNS